MNSPSESKQLLPGSYSNYQNRGYTYYPAPVQDAKDESNSLGQIIGLIRRRWIIIGTVAILISGVMIAKVKQETPIYQGSFQLLVNPDAGQEKRTQINFGNGAPLQSSKTDFDTQIRVISSPQVMEPVLQAIQKKYPEVNYYSLMGSMAINKVGSSEILQISYKDANAEKITFILKQIAKGYVDYSIAQQKGSIGQGLQFVDGQLEKLRIRVDKLQGELQQFRQNNNLIEPEGQGQYVSGQLNSIVQQRLDTRSRFGEAQSTYKTLLGQLRMEPETALALTALNESPRYQQLLTQLKEIETKIAIESARFTEESPPIQALREQQANVAYLLQQETQQILGTKIPEGVAETLSNPNGMPNAMRAGMLQQLLTITTELRTLQVRDAALAEAQNLASKQLKRMAEVSREYTDLQRELKVATESLQRFLVVKENLEVENAQKTVPWQLISQPVASGIPISPNIPRSASTAVLIGLVAGIAAALLADKLDNVYHVPEELKEDTGLPVLGTIPFKKDLKRYGSAISNDVASGQNLEEASRRKSYYYYGASAFLESFRSLHANLNFINPDKPLKSLVVSSCVPADGKSTIATNLAQAAAAMGQRVLLVDADLRRPQVHNFTDLPNVWGLSNVISSEIDVNDVIQRSPQEDNLYILTAGQLPPDPSRLLSSKKMQSLVEQFEEEYDLVIFDTPPMLGLADGRILSAYTDGLLLVVRLDKTNRDMVNQTMDALKVSRTPILGLVANGVSGYAAKAYDYYSSYYQTPAPTQSEMFEHNFISSNSGNDNGQFY